MNYDLAIHIALLLCVLGIFGCLCYCRGFVVGKRTGAQEEQAYQLRRVKTSSKERL